MNPIISNRIVFVSIFLISQNSIFSSLYSMNSPSDKTYLKKKEIKVIVSEILEKTTNKIINLEKDKLKLRKRLLNNSFRDVKIVQTFESSNLSYHFKKYKKNICLHLFVVQDYMNFWFSDENQTILFKLENGIIEPFFEAERPHFEKYPELVFSAQILLVCANKNKTLFDQSSTKDLKTKSLKKYRDVMIKTYDKDEINDQEISDKEKEVRS